MNPKLLLGSHISLNRPSKYLLGVVEETIHNGADVFMIFTGPPQNKRRVAISELYLEEAQKLGKEHGIDFSNCVVHAPYIINPANTNSENKDFTISFLSEEVKRTGAMGIPYIVLHPGYHVGNTLDEGIELLIENLKLVLKECKDTNVFICLETMAGKKNQIGKTLEEIAKIIKGCDNHPKLAVCLDTVHLHDAGYDLSKKDEFLKKFDELIGLERIKVVHLGDSMNVRGSGKDRHANLDYGHIGFEILMEWAYEPLFRKLPIIVETPYWREKGKLISPYKHEIKLIRSREWKPIPNKKYIPIYNKFILQ
ncbi:endonuclease IV [Candidatus Mycoplasma haematobovis]|uniref:Probable endonuclease 4 n=1 Tax=Candidatus Mycoplasma haematobovis TaxID=432608 RepID=A0A1A9QG80_9MOLU|nr:deoxyribonuclease IV [Candidatus Mycoplasma haematobovis]OAL10720.1 endonuclease IV [Candidatus Mycoplasma haematobovis]